MYAVEFSATVLSPGDDQFLEDLEKANFQFFWEQADPQTGLVKDRCNVRIEDKSTVASIAATGFGLTALCIGQQRGYVSLNDARERASVTLRFLFNNMKNHRGFFYHCANINTGDRIWDSEISSVDTALLLCGILTCRRHFHSSEITRLANDIFNRVEWTWLSADTTLLPHGWSPEIGFLPYRWDVYSELMMLYLLGLGSACASVADRACGMRGSGAHSNTTAFGILVRMRRYSSINTRRPGLIFAANATDMRTIFRNSIIATDVHRRFCLELEKQFPVYSDDLWGITASDSQKGYVVWGGPPLGPIDGTVVPSAAAGSLPFMPQAAMRVLKTIKESLWYMRGAAMDS